jgi:predicted membrane-bound spermidine synthase
MIRLAAALTLFFVSGFAALLYQVIWQRLLVFFSGADVHSATVVVAAFMAGLGCGSFAGGQVADRVSRVTSLALFALAELAVAVFGFFSSTLFYDVLYVRLGHLDVGALPTALMLFGALLWPTFFMGASLPLLSRGLTRDVDHAASTIGLLYGLNTAGAAAGAFAATWVLLPQAGLQGSLRAAAGLNLLCAMAAVPLAAVGRTANGESTRGDARAETAAADAPSIQGRRVMNWALLFAVSGFIGLSLEIVWFRLLGVMLKSTSFTFGTLLAVYLAGLASGSALGSLVAARIRRPASWFLLLQAGAGAYAALGLTLFVNGLDRGALEWFNAYFKQYDGVDLRAAIEYWRGTASGDAVAARDAWRLYVLLPLMLIGPPTLMAGMSFPLLQRVVQTDLDRLGRRVGLLLTSNVVGSTIGAFVTGLLLLDWVGTSGTLRLLFAISAGFAVAAIWQLTSRTQLRRVLLAVVVTGAAAVVWVMPGSAELWARLHGTSSQLIIQGEDGSGLSVLRGERADFRRTVVYVNGLGQSWVPYGGIHTVLGALPAFVHPHPRRAALIGLGSGDTLFAMAGRTELEHITSIEIIAPQLTTLRALAAWQGYPGLQGILQDPRIEHVEGDGRRYLSRTHAQFDIIQADALRPHSAYAGNLYSDAYFRLLRDRLAPDGLAVSWAPTERIVRTFLGVFPHVARHGDIMLGSKAPIELDPDAISRRLADQHVKDHYAMAGVDIAALLAPYREGWQVFPSGTAPAVAEDINTDLRPRDEFNIPPVLDLPFDTD